MWMLAIMTKLLWRTMVVVSFRRNRVGVIAMEHFRMSAEFAAVRGFRRVPVTAMVM
jgi:hypothetical protein